MSLDPKTYREILTVFKSEFEELSQVIVDSLLALENAKDNKVLQQQLIESIFRSAHTIKGAAFGLSLSDLGELSHKIESLFSKIKTKQIDINRQIIDLCLSAIDAMKLILSNACDNKSESTHLDEITEKLLKILDTESDVNHKPDKKVESTEVKVSDESDNKVDITVVNQPQQVDVSVQQKATEISKDEFIRVNVNRLDTISRLFEEIYEVKIRVDDHWQEYQKIKYINSQFVKAWEKLFRTIKTEYTEEFNEYITKLYQDASQMIEQKHSLIDSQYNNLRNSVSDLNILTNLVKDEIRVLRLIPASSLTGMLPRYVRDLSHELNKNIQLIIEGDSVKLDKLVLDQLKDPLIHLIRNAIDHGIGDEATRKAVNKSEVGTIRIAIQDQGGKIIISVSDDGAGINVDEIKKIAISSGLVTSGDIEKMDKKEIYQLMFMPGFTTKKIVSSVSGRGVGLDVVRTNILHLKGNINVTSILGKGTTFSIEVPLTLASERGLLVSCSGTMCVIPTSNVEKLVSVTKKDLVEIGNSYAIVVGGQSVEIKSLAQLLNLEAGKVTYSDHITLVITNIDSKRHALLVDEVIKEQEIVIKPLNKPINDNPCFLGGALSESGQVITVLNVHYLLTQRNNAIDKIKLVYSDKKQAKVNVPSILVVDDSITTRTLEKNILESKHYHVTVAVNGQQAWELIQKHHFSLVITDVNMPFMDGFELTQKIKTSEKYASIPVIIVTSLNSEIEKQRGIEVGANAYIVKSEFESGSLLEIVAQMV